ncbi:hypothetical protein BV133_2529 [Blastochloris viridis]|uniref:Uncharacterized protein n=1 Tax=Blastochloris viridis TaxID=1079 RepID=A0A182D5R1_BLAVI|nr:hypothetical protein BV133_2529 [Blastochloris viridis]
MRSISATAAGSLARPGTGRVFRRPPTGYDGSIRKGTEP